MRLGVLWRWGLLLVALGMTAIPMRAHSEDSHGLTWEALQAAQTTELAEAERAQVDESQKLIQGQHAELVSLLYTTGAAVNGLVAKHSEERRELVRTHVEEREQIARTHAEERVAFMTVNAGGLTWDELEAAETRERSGLLQAHVDDTRRVMQEQNSEIASFNSCTYHATSDRESFTTMHAEERKELARMHAQERAEIVKTHAEERVAFMKAHSSEKKVPATASPCCGDPALALAGPDVAGRGR